MLKTINEKEFVKKIEQAIKEKNADWLSENMWLIHNCDEWHKLAKERTEGAELFD